MNKYILFKTAAGKELIMNISNINLASVEVSTAGGNTSFEMYNYELSAKTTLKISGTVGATVDNPLIAKISDAMVKLGSSPWTYAVEEVTGYLGAGVNDVTFLSLTTS